MTVNGWMQIAILPRGARANGTIRRLYDPGLRGPQDLADAGLRAPRNAVLQDRRRRSATRTALDPVWPGHAGVLCGRLRRALCIDAVSGRPAAQSDGPGGGAGGSC